MVQAGPHRSVMAVLISPVSFSTGTKNKLTIKTKSIKMIKGNFARTIMLSLAVVVLFGACRKREDVSLPDNLIVFTSSAQGIDQSENSIVVKVKLSRGTDRDIPVVIHLTPQGVTYGT